MPENRERRTRVSVLMPTFRQAVFISRAIESLLAQTFTDWELIVIDDGSPDDTVQRVEGYLADERISYHRLDRNAGLGAALNHGLSLAQAPFLAYLPSDDVYYTQHLASLLSCLDSRPDAPLAFSGVRRERHVLELGGVEDLTSTGRVHGFSLQLVQVMHRQTHARWTERSELVTDDLHRMFWSKCLNRGPFVGTGEIDCEWVDHPHERHKIIQEPWGGVNPYRAFYQVRKPLVFHSTRGSLIDEKRAYENVRERPPTEPARDQMTILFVGELAYNPERVVALEERGHRLLGFWTSNPRCFTTVGPLPFGHVDDISATDWKQSIVKARPDIIYALLNSPAVPVAHQVLIADLGIPFVWHMKESPFQCIAEGTWPQLVDLHTRSHGQVYSSPELRDWFATAVPASATHDHWLVLDGDLPKKDGEPPSRSPLLSSRDGEVHTVLPGCPAGISIPLVGALAARRVHVHFYGDFHQIQCRDWVAAARRVAPHHLHLHPHVDRANWVSELSQYDAGWLPQFRSRNLGDLHRAQWGDLNYAARVGTLAVSGVPMIFPRSAGSIVAMQNLLAQHDLGVLYSDADDLATQLYEEPKMYALRQNVWRQRHLFMFDHHADRLVRFFRDVAHRTDVDRSSRVR